MYDSSRIATRLGWRSRVSQREALDRLIASELGRQKAIPPEARELAASGVA
jgi:hypothetical protein